MVVDMWLSFFIATFICLCSLFVPGYLQARSIGLCRLACAAFAPLCSVAEYSIFGAILGLLGISANAAIIYGLILLISLILCLTQKTRKGEREFSFSEWLDFKSFLLYVLIGVVIGGWFFVKNLDGPCSFVQEFDNAYHLNLITTFISTGRFSFLQATNFPTDITPFSDLSFYPAGWHVVVSLVGSILNANAALVENAGIFVFISFVYPLSWYVFLSIVFKGDKTLVPIGSFVCYSFASFPFGFLVAGPLYSNMASLALLPGALALYWLVFIDEASWQGRKPLLPLLLVAVLSLAITQTNTIFTAIIVMLPITVWRIWSYASRCKSIYAGIAYSGLFLLFVLAFLAICYKLPFFSSVVHNPYVPYTATVSQALFDFWDFGYRNTVAQPLMLILVVFGLYSAVWKKSFLWGIAPLLYFCIAYVSAAAVPGGLLSDFLSGFWFNDVDRIAASVTILLVPLAVLGVNLLLRVVLSVGCSLFPESREPGNLGIIRLMTCALLLLIIFQPSHIDAGNGYVNTAFGQRDARLAELASEELCLPKEEESFLNDVKEIVGDALVINDPYDGSAFAYSVSNINTMYRHFFSSDKESDLAIQERLNYYGEDNEVRDAVHSWGAKYVLLLDSKYLKGDSSYLSEFYVKHLWEGIDCISENTPGFELVLKKDDMCLYRISE